MINDTSRQRWQRAQARQLDAQFTTTIIHGMDCSPFEAEAMGRALTHRTQIVRRWLAGEEYAEIAAATCHSVASMASYVDKCKRSAALLGAGFELETVALIARLSPALVRAFQTLLAQAHPFAHRQEELQALSAKRGGSRAAPGGAPVSLPAPDQKHYSSARKRFLTAALAQFFEEHFPRHFGPLLRERFAAELLAFIEHQLLPTPHLRPGQCLWNAVPIDTARIVPTCASCRSSSPSCTKSTSSG